MSDQNPRPLVSVGLAVYNGERYLEEAVDSILNQTFTDFELILSDNASTDRTPEICLRYCRQDRRVRYHRNASNIGGANNENQTVRMARGKYFRWAADDDKLAPDLLARCVEVLETAPSVVLCYSIVVSIDEAGTNTGVVSRNNGASDIRWKRMAAIALSDDFLEESYGLMRLDVLRKTPLQANYTASDRTLMCELSLYGKFYEVPEPLFFKRFHARNVYSDWRTRMAWFDQKFVGKIVFPWWVQFFDYFRTIHRVPLPLREKLLCYLFMGRWVMKFGKKMAKDVAVAIYMLAHSKDWRNRQYEKSGFD